MNVLRRIGRRPPPTTCCKGVGVALWTKKWEGGDLGVAHQKTPTSLLLTPDKDFHSFGYTAPDYYHDLDPEEAQDWLYLEKFKMKKQSTTDLTMNTELEAINGKKVQALELRDQCLALNAEEAIRWVLTVPAIWKQPAKHERGCLSENPEQLLIALEPELIIKALINGYPFDRSIDSSFRQGDRYIVADCGGGTVDLTVHQIEQPKGTLKELYKASAWMDLMIAFEAWKRTAAPQRSNHLNISLPFSLIDFYRKNKGQNVETALRKS
ncbi:hypothetical protein XELAEV_18008766mg [Xenopus laevis]|uniref:Uncharacterized protein n=1 Tax=Xenopus laevis TaxID=8355 RepID=A0A974I078_XENLA|nr:hypothetical protein XELAEV_18008766mg [Xenopus laevis]